MQKRLAALVLAGALASVSGCGGDGDDSGSAGATSTDASGAADAPACVDSFKTLAEAETAEEGLDAGGLGLTIRSCESEAAWRAAAKQYASALGGFSPDEALGMACALESQEGETRPVCANAGK